MDRLKAITILRNWDKQARYVFLKQDLVKLFPEDSEKTFSAGLARLVKEGILQRVCHAVYVYRDAVSFDAYVLERIAIARRRGEYNYVSLESALSEYGVISQIPIDRLTIMTTGRSGLYKTPYGVIELTHTKRSRENILENTLKIEDRPLRIAKKLVAWRDLKRVGRNVHMVNQEELKDD